METSVLQRSDQPRGRLAAAVMALGGAISFVGSLLTWATVKLTAAARTNPANPRAQGSPRRAGRVGSSFTLTGLNTAGGKAVLALSVALIVVALLAVLAYWYWLRLGAMAIGLVLGVIVLVSSAVDLASPASMFGVASLQLGRRGIPVSAGVGLYLAVAGAAVAVLASAAWLVMSRPRWASPATFRGAPGPATSQPRPDEQPTTQPPPAANPELATD